MDLTGQVFGELTAIRELEERVNKNVAWLCSCSCGNETVAMRSNLLKGAKKSCGCLRKRPPANALDLNGKTFGLLSVMRRLEKATKGGNALWLCECLCGNKVEANASSLKRGDTVSCGCDKDMQIANARKKLKETGNTPLLEKKVRSDSGTGHKGVSRRVRKGVVRYEVSITLQGKRKYVGFFKNLDDAIQARELAEKELFDPYKKEKRKSVLEDSEYPFDLSKFKFGKLRALHLSGDVDKHGNLLWVCSCFCGNKVIYSRNYLVHDKVTCCGCTKAPKKHKQKLPKDITGLVFGELTVVKQIDNTSWFCQCSCGNTKQVKKSQLDGSVVRSCGCKKGAPSPHPKDLTALTFNRLTVIKKSDSQRNYWLCRCSCGNLKEVWRYSLTNGSTKSCGCLLDEYRKENKELISNILRRKKRNE